MSDYQEIMKKLAIDATTRKAVKEGIKEVDQAEAKLKAAMAEFAKAVLQETGILEANSALDEKPFCLIVPIVDHDEGDPAFRKEFNGECGEMELKLVSLPSDGSSIQEWTFELKGKFCG